MEAIIYINSDRNGNNDELCKRKFEFTNKLGKWLAYKLQLYLDHFNTKPDPSISKIQYLSGLASSHTFVNISKLYSL